MISSPSTVVILGWRTALVRGARDLGLDVVVLYTADDLRWSHPRLESVDGALLVEDPGDVVGSLMALARAGLADGIAGVCPSGEDYVVAAAAMNAALGLPRLPVAAAIACRDKDVQKSLVRAAGIPTPDSAPFHPRDGQPDWTAFPAVVKPADGYGTVGTSVVDDATALSSLVSELAREHRGASVIETFVDADQEWEVDGVVVNGKVEFMSLGVYGAPCLRVRDGEALTVFGRDPARHEDEYAQAHELAQGAVTALGITDAVIHLEAFLVAGRLVFGECAARAGGGLTQDMVLRKHGVDLSRAQVAAATGLAGAISSVASEALLGFAFLPSRAGVLRDLPTVAEIEALDGVVHVDLQLEPGFVMRDHAEGINNRLGLVMVEADTDAALAERIESALDLCRQRTVIEPVHAPVG